MEVAEGILPVRWLSSTSRIAVRRRCTALVAGVGAVGNRAAWRFHHFASCSGVFDQVDRRSGGEQFGVHQVEGDQPLAAHREAGHEEIFDAWTNGHAVI